MQYQHLIKDLETVRTRGRGATANPVGRYEKLDVAIDSDWQNHNALDDDYDERPQIATQYFKDSSKTIITYNKSPDICFAASINPYRGCEHGCIYCYARPGHEYLGLSAGLDFETKIFVKHEAPQLLRQELQKPGWQPQPLSMSGVTDCYQPVERQLKITRQCLEVLADFRNPAGIVTKNHLVTRDIDLLQRLAHFKAARVMISITTLDPKLARQLEPRASTPARRLQAVRELSQAGIPVGIMMAPIIPGLTDDEIPAVLEAAADAGALSAGYIMLRLPYGIKDLFAAWLDEHLPLRKDKILHRMQDVRGGKLYDAEFNTRMRGTGFFADQVSALFSLYQKKYRLDRGIGGLSAQHFRRTPDQPSLFD